MDAIVCIDACFTQKRCKSRGNAWVSPRSHPETVFIPRDEVDMMEVVVEETRPSIHSRPPVSTHDRSEPDVQPGLRVPNAVLNECNDSFVAADEKRVKASTQFFSDTALMAMLCRHDRVLWLVNMTSAGEKQHYALSLIQKLFDHIPSSMRIGLLYDIGCQLNRSCLKFGFLKDCIDRIVFGISVFHAYGHQWACQLVYHPRKCKGFGLSDGEGCERFWRAIRPLIPSCRVSGYYNRIYTIDTQVKHLDERSLMGLGRWLGRKWSAMFLKRAEALVVLDRLELEGWSYEDLDAQWKAQVYEQTKPLKKQSKGAADKAIEEILAVLKNIEDYRVEIVKLETMVEEGEYPEGMDFYAADEALYDLNNRLQKAKHAVDVKRTKLGVDHQLALHKLLGNEFLRLRMNALALKQRIRERLRHRKFELENLERAYRTTINQKKLTQHAEKQVKRKEPGIQALARNYNKICSQLTDMINKNKAPLGAISPLPIEATGLFKLDVDDDIWQDIGLTNDTDGDDTIPSWLGDDNVREGIKSLLVYQRCQEEERRLIAERLSMQQWMREEWATVLMALHSAISTPDLHYQLQLRQKYLVRLCLSWKVHIMSIPAQMEDNWGPTEAELDRGRGLEVSESVLDIEEIVEDEYENEDDGYDAEILDTMEIQALADQF